jgi:hypothetical protein
MSRGRFPFDAKSDSSLRQRAGRTQAPLGMTRLDCGGFAERPRAMKSLEQVPEELVVDLVVVLDFGALDEGAEIVGAAVGGSALQFRIARLYIRAQ